MRTFKLMIMVALAFGITACASEDDDNCGQTDGCVPPPPDTCGDGACQSGENAQNCAEDCVPDTCGDGTCDGAENADNCASDCQTVCTSPQMPVYCADTNSCWEAGTDCSLPSYTCVGGAINRCGGAEAAVNCCSDAIYECWKEAPYYCPSTGDCLENMADCPGGGSSCTVWGLACS